MPTVDEFGDLAASRCASPDRAVVFSSSEHPSFQEERLADEVYVGCCSSQDRCPDRRFSVDGPDLTSNLPSVTSGCEANDAQKDLSVFHSSSSDDRQGKPVPEVSSGGKDRVDEIRRDIEVRQDCDSTSMALGGEACTPRQRLQQHWLQTAGRITIPDTWGREQHLQDWGSYGIVEDALRPPGLMLARNTLINDSLARSEPIALSASESTILSRSC